MTVASVSSKEPASGGAGGLCDTLSRGFERATKTTLYKVFMMIVSIYFIYVLLQTYANQEDGGAVLQFSTTRPIDRCVPLFDKAASLGPPGSILYYYNTSDGTQRVQVCTNLSAQEVDATLGAEYRYDVYSDATGGQCSTSEPNATARAMQSCVAGYGVGDCAAALRDSSPAPAGVAWMYGLTPASSGGRCAMELNPYSPAPPPCKGSHIWAYKKENAAVSFIFLTAIVYTFVRLISEFAGVCCETNCCAGRSAPSTKFCNYYQCCDKCREWGFCFALALDGLAGPVFEGYKAVMKFKEIEDTKYRELTLVEICIVRALDVIPSIAMPIIALSGCTISGWMSILLLIHVIIGVIKLLITVATRVYRCVAGGGTK